MERIDEQKQMLIEKFLDGILTEKEKILFQDYIKDPDFREELRFQKNLQNAVKRKMSQEHPLKLLFQEEEKKIAKGEIGTVPELPTPTPIPSAPDLTLEVAEADSAGAKRIPLRTWLSYAAGIAILITAGILFIPKTSTPPDQGDQIAGIKNLQRPPQMTQITKSTGSDRPLDSLALDCITLFKSQTQYPDALNCFQDLATRQSTPEIQYYIGQCYLNTDSFDQAIQQYDNLLLQGQITNPDTIQQIRWNRLIAKVLDKREGYQQELEAMVGDDDFRYLKEAMEMKALLDRKGD